MNDEKTKAERCLNRKLDAYSDSFSHFPYFNYYLMPFQPGRGHADMSRLQNKRR